MDELEEDVPNPVVARADAFMHRRRSQSSPGEADDLPILTEVIDPEDDLPVLTSEEAEEAAPPESIDATVSAYDPAVLNILAHELADRMEERFAAEMPDLVATALQSAMAEIAAELHDKIRESAETVIRDFLAERERLAKIQQQR